MIKQPFKILLAEDDTDDCVFFEKALMSINLLTHLTAVHDGEELMNHLNDKQELLPDIIFLDINMPRKNGLECLTAIKKNQLLRNIPVVMLSTSNSEIMISSAFSKGANIYIRKPGDITNMKQVISHALPIATQKIFLNSTLKYIFNAGN